MSSPQPIRTAVAAAILLGLVTFALSCQKKSAEPAQQAATAGADSARAVGLGRGQQAFLSNCAMCHGESGQGDGPLAPELIKEGLRAPARLDDRTRLAQIGRDEVIRVITQGGGHTGRSNLMPPWGEKLSSAVIDTIADFVMSLPDLQTGTPQTTLQKYLEAPSGSSAEGRKLFVFYCTGCHGPFGKGDGPFADTLFARNRIRPRNLTDSVYFARKTDKELYITVSLGGAHSGKSPFMPAWTSTMTPAQIKDLLSYVRAISRTPSQP